MKEHRIVGAFVAILAALCIAGIAQAQTRVTPCDAVTPTNALCVTWNAVTTRTDGLPTTFPVTYRVEQQIGTGAFATVATAAPTLYYAKTLAPGTYTYRVFAIENAVVSDASNTASKAVVQAAPSAPILIIAATIRAGQPPTYRIVYTVRPREGELVFVAPESMRAIFAANPTR